MNPLLTVFTSSIGKKLLMAVTGFCFCGFLVVHLIGNLTVYGGSETFSAYVEHLHSLGVLINVAELGLVLLALVHVTTGTVLFYQNWRSRPVRYAVRKSSGGRTIGSATMPYTGFFILVFLVIHLIGFRLEVNSGRSVYEIMTGAFTSPLTVAVYVMAVLVVAIHISHGFWSLFQTVGFNHAKYSPLIARAGLAFAAVVAAGFGLIPVYLIMI
ncbi:MAG: succinate dehydrogenase cytochrome b subunit [Thermodesulfobacteriota bacterium]